MMLTPIKLNTGLDLCTTLGPASTTPNVDRCTLPLATSQVISTARTCNLILIVLDCLKPISHKKIIEHELEGFGIRLNKRPPNITFRKKDKGGITFTSSVKDGKLDLDSVRAVCIEYR